MSVPTEIPVEQIDVGDMELWNDGFPHAVFERLRREEPVHWSPMATWKGEPGFWSITRADDIHAISRDWQTFSSQEGGIVVTDHGTPLELQTQMFIAMDPPRHDRIKALFQRGFTPKRINEHEEKIRAIVTRTLDRLQGREEIELVSEIATPVVSRVIGSFVGTAEADDAGWSEFALRAMAFGDDELQPGGLETVMQQIHKVFEDGGKLVAERRASPTDDLTSVLVTAEVDGEGLSDEEIIMGFALLQLAGNDSTKATFSNGMLALLQNRDQWQKLVDDPSKIEGAVEEILRLAPAFSHFRRTARATSSSGASRSTRRQGRAVVPLGEPRREPSTSARTCSTSTATPSTKPSAPAAGISALAQHWLAWNCGSSWRRRIKRWPEMELLSEPDPVRSLFLNQQKAIRVRVAAGSAGH